MINLELTQLTNAYSLLYNIRKIWSPTFFQGNGKTKNYFEGWYFKIVSADGRNKISVIPGVAFGKKAEEAHAFIQLMDGSNATSEYFSFKSEDFGYSKKAFEIRVGKSFFSERKIELDIEADRKRVWGQLEFSNIRPLPGSFFFSRYHGMVSVCPADGMLSWCGKLEP